MEACVLHRLRQRAVGFLHSNKIAALFMKVGKSFPPAEELSCKVQDLEQLIESTTEGFLLPPSSPPQIAPSFPEPHPEGHGQQKQCKSPGEQGHGLHFA
ncbi:hypothetical protein MC885_013631, partial [Smutsia gigantea]